MRMKESLPVVLAVLCLNLRLNLAAGRSGMGRPSRRETRPSEPRVTTHRAQPFRCALPCLLSPTVEVCALLSLIVAMSSTRLTLLDQTFVVC